MAPTSFRVFLSRLFAPIRRRQRDARLAEEIDAHLDALADDYLARGLSEADARLAARRSFGGLDRMKMLHREQHGLPMLQWFWFDLRSACRALARERWFAIGVVLVLAMGLSVNTAIFTIINGMTWRQLPVYRGDRIVQVTSQRLEGRREGLPTSYADYLAWRNATRTLAGVAAYGSAVMNAGDDMHPADRLAGNFVSAHAFSLLGVPPILGRDFNAQDDVPGSAPVVILGHHVWTSRYAADSGIVGQIIRINGMPTTIVGVMPEGFQFPIRADVWRPIGQMPDLDVADRRQRRFDIVGRLRDGVTVEEARAEMDAIARALAAQHPATNGGVGTRTTLFTYAFVAPLRESQEPLVMLIAAAIVLLIACANGANLLLARAASRAREMAMRATLGASRFRIVRQLLVEALLMSAAAGAVGLALSVAAVRTFALETADANLPFWIAFDFDARVFGYVAAACLGTAVLFGLAPAWHLSKTDAHEVLKEGGRGSIGGRRTRRWAAALLVSELALTMILLGGASTLVRGSAELGSQDAILDVDRLLAGEIALPATRYDAPGMRRSLIARIQERLADPAQQLSATLSTARPFLGSTSRQLLLEGEARDRAQPVDTIGIGDRYFDTLGLPLLRGRALGANDAAEGREAAIVNDRFVQVHFPRTDPIGQRIRLIEPGPSGDEREQRVTVVGVAPSIRQRIMGQTAPIVYLPIEVHPSRALTITARTGEDRQRTVAAIREQVRAVDADVAVYNINSVRRLSQLSRWPARMVSLVLALFAIVASVLSAAGLYAMTAYGVTQRTAELGLRVALGARRAQVAWSLLRSTCLQVALGLTIGLAGAFAVGQLLRRVLVRTAATDGSTLAVVGGLAVLVTCAACYFPARRAVRLDPVAALRHD